jgi:uncharacterized membrane protein YkoI
MLNLRCDGTPGSTWTGQPSTVKRFEERVMRTSTNALMVIGLGLAGATSLTVRAQNAREKEVSLDQVPAAVRATILNEAAGAEITEIEKESNDGRITYEAEFLIGGREVEIQVAPDGTLLARETEDEDDEDELTIGQVPQPARAALLKLAGGATIIEAGREREDGAVVYEAAWMANGIRHEVEVAADGALLESEKVIPAADAPAGVRDAIATHFGADAKVVVEMKMIVLYEIKAEVDGEEEELLVLPTGRVIKERDGDDDGEDDAGEEDDDD